MWNNLVIYSLCFIACCGAVFIDYLPDNDRYQTGDLVLAVMLPRSRQKPGEICSTLKSRISVTAAAAFVFGIKRINANNTLLPNITLGYLLMDDCNNEAVAVMKATQLMPVKQCVKGGCKAENTTKPQHKVTAGYNAQYNVIGLVGPYGSTLQLRTSLLLSFYKIPHISWIATSDALSDKWRYGYFSRVVPPDRFQAEALVDIVDHYNWTYVSILHSEGTYGSTGVRYVNQGIKNLGICTAFSQELRDDFVEADYDNTIRQLQKFSKARVVLLFLESRHGQRLMLALERKKAVGQFILLSTEGMHIAQLRQVTFAKRNWLRLNIGAGFSTEFRSQYRELSPFGGDDKLWTGEYTAESLGCSWSVPENHSTSCARYKTFKDVASHSFTNWPARLLDAVQTFALATHSLIYAKCPAALRDKSLLANCIESEELQSHIRKTKFQGESVEVEFNSDGDFIGGGYQITSNSWENNKNKEIHMGKWIIKTGETIINESMVMWWINGTNGTQIRTDEIPESVCAKPCSVGEFYLMGEQTCCWECRRCRENEVLRADLKGCETCALKTWPDQTNFSTCEPIPPTYMHWLDPIALGLTAMAAIVMLVVLLITGIFIKHREKKVIKGSNRELMVPIILGLFLALTTVYLFIARAEDWVCYLNYFGFNLSCTLIFGPLLLKTVRMYRIFAAAERCELRLRGVDSTTQIVAMSFILLIQLFITISVCIYQPPIAEETMPVPTTRHVELSCRLPEENLLSALSYNILLLLLCSVFGFMTRKLPDNFNESWYILISVSTTLFVWVAFLPTYFMAFYAYHKSALLGFALVLNGFVTVLCFFAPKLYALYFIDESNLKVTNFDFSDEKKTND